MVKPYEAPMLQLLGSVAEFTLSPRTCSPSNPCEKNYNPISDGFTFQNQKINYS